MNSSRAKRSLKGGCSLRPEPSRLGVPAAATQIPPRWKWHYQRLLYLLQQCHHAQREHLRDAADTTPGCRPDFADTASDEFQRDMLLNEAASEQDLIYEIEQALRRIESGTYAVCELTGKPISRARLRAIPWTRFSASVERELERNGSVHFQRLGQLASANLK